MSLVAVRERIGARLYAKAAAVRLQLENRLDRIVLAWLFLAGLACAVRIAFSPLKEPLGFEIVLPYVLLVCAPVASLLLALRWFADGERQPQPQFRLAVLGRWRTVDRARAAVAGHLRSEGLPMSPEALTGCHPPRCPGHQE